MLCFPFPSLHVYTIDSHFKKNTHGEGTEIWMNKIVRSFIITEPPARTTALNAVKARRRLHLSRYDFFLQERIVMTGHSFYSIGNLKANGEPVRCCFTVPE